MMERKNVDMLCEKKLKEIEAQRKNYKAIEEEKSHVYTVYHKRYIYT